MNYQSMNWMMKPDGYRDDGAAKALYHKEAKRVLRMVAKLLGLAPGTFYVVGAKGSRQPKKGVPTLRDKRPTVL